MSEKSNNPQPEKKEEEPLVAGKMLIIFYIMAFISVLAVVITALGVDIVVGGILVTVGSTAMIIITMGFRSF